MEMFLRAGEYFDKGGAVMYLLLFCSIAVVTIAVERALYFRAADSGRNFTEKFCALLRGKRSEEAATLAAGGKGDNARILSEAMRKRGASRARIEAFLEADSGIAIARLRRRLYYLNVIVTLSPLLGLLGTISGMISSFSVFSLQAGEPMAITGGIGEALIATATGLCVAVLALCVHAYFAQRLDTLVTDMEQCFSVLSESLEREDAV